MHQDSYQFFLLVAYYTFQLWLASIKLQIVFPTYAYYNVIYLLFSLIYLQLFTTKLLNNRSTFGSVR